MDFAANLAEAEGQRDEVRREFVLLKERTARQERSDSPLPPVRAADLSPYCVNSLGMEFVLIPAGEFMMGSADDDPNAHDNEKPAHKVTIGKAFYLGKYAVTLAQWEAVMGYDPSRFRDDPRYPVENVSWYDVQEFIQCLNRKEGHDRYRLPTEAEWEYACRAGSSSAFSFGDDGDRLARHAWYEENSKDGRHPVGELAPNTWGLYDMHGNVWEWVQDAYDRAYYRRSPSVDPRGPDAGLRRVIRGGDWRHGAQDCRSAARVGDRPDYRYDDIGFRLALSPV
jgi:formylglycine-generating enzyme required for sulfatase activity